MVTPLIVGISPNLKGEDNIYTTLHNFLEHAC